ncbi:hypothetical protein NKDENANG_00012 [Candidatus Entotheonellaceae bacterium PAL068K]
MRQSAVLQPLLGQTGTLHHGHQPGTGEVGW